MKKDNQYYLVNIDDIVISEQACLIASVLSFINKKKPSKETKIMELGLNIIKKLNLSKSLIYGIFKRNTDTLVSFDELIEILTEDGYEDEFSFDTISPLSNFGNFVAKVDSDEIREYYIFFYNNEYQKMILEDTVGDRHSFLNIKPIEDIEDTVAYLKEKDPDSKIFYMHKDFEKHEKYSDMGILDQHYPKNLKIYPKNFFSDHTSVEVW